MQKRLVFWSADRFWIAKHFWSIYLTLTEQFYEPCRPFILLEAHWFSLNSFDPTWNREVGDLAGSERWGRVFALLSLAFLLRSWFIGTSAHLTEAQSVSFAISLLQNKETSKQRETILFSLTTNQTTSAAKSIYFFHSLKQARAVILTLEPFSTWTINPKSFAVAKSGHNGFLK